MAKSRRQTPTTGSGCSASISWVSCTASAASCLDGRAAGLPCHVVNTAYAAGLLTSPLMGAYNVSKHAVVTLSETLSTTSAPAASASGLGALPPLSSPTASRSRTATGPQSFRRRGRPPNSYRADQPPASVHLRADLTARPTTTRFALPPPARFTWKLYLIALTLPSGCQRRATRARPAGR